MRLHRATVSPEPLRGGLQAEKAPGGWRRQCQGDRNTAGNYSVRSWLQCTDGFTGSILSFRKDALIYLSETLDVREISY